MSWPSDPDDEGTLPGVFDAAEATEEDAEELDDDAPQLVVVVDTGVIIDVKRLVPHNQQWKALATMLELVQAGRLAFPSKVHRELTSIKWMDAPGVWCSEAVKEVQFPDPEDATLAEILEHTEDLVEKDADDRQEKADPYVVAMAYELLHADPPYDVVVATTDTVDRPGLKIAMTTACERLAIPCWTFEDFIKWVEQAAQSAGDAD